MDKFLRRRLALGTVITTMILLSVVAVMGTVGLLYYKGNFQTFKKNVLTPLGNTTNKNDESAMIENVVYNTSTKAFSITLTNNGDIGINLKTVTLKDLNGKVLAITHPDNLTFAIDNAATTSAKSTSSPLQFNVNVGAQSNRILIVTVGAEDPYAGGDTSQTCDAITVTYNGVPLTMAERKGLADPSGNDQCDSIWYMLNPPNGNFQVSITYGHSTLTDAFGGAFVLYNAAQQGPETTSSNGILSGCCIHSITTTIGTSTDGDYIFEAVGSGDPGAFDQGGQTIMYQLLGTSSQHMATTKLAPKAGSYSIQETQPASVRRFVQVLAAFKHDCNLILPDQSCTVGLAYQNFANPVSLSITTSRGNVFTTIVAPRVS